MKQRRQDQAAGFVLDFDSPRPVFFAHEKLSYLRDELHRMAVCGFQIVEDHASVIVNVLGVGPEIEKVPGHCLSVSV
jgi:hypothetical protein